MRLLPYASCMCELFYLSSEALPAARVLKNQPVETFRVWDVGVYLFHKAEQAASAGAEGGI